MGTLRVVRLFASIGSLTSDVKLSKVRVVALVFANLRATVGQMVPQRSNSRESLGYVQPSFIGRHTLGANVAVGYRAQPSPNPNVRVLSPLWLQPTLAAHDFLFVCFLFLSASHPTQSNDVRSSHSSKRYPRGVDGPYAYASSLRRVCLCVFVTIGQTARASRITRSSR